MNGITLMPAPIIEQTPVAMRPSSPISRARPVRASELSGLPAITCREEYQARPAIAIIHAALEHRQMEETPIRIAEPEPDDADWCARLMTSSEPWMSLGRDLTSCRESLGRPGTELLVARSAGVPVGF